jgi:hypothetical protein
MASKPITGQYECEHQSGVGLDYFTSRVDKLVLQPDGRFVLTLQDRSRVANAAQSLMKGQQITNAAPEKKLEGTYKHEDDTLGLYFDNGGYEPGKVSWNGDGVQLGPNFFRKVSDSTLLPSTHRMKKDMDDIARGLKIATTLGSMAVKAVKTVQGVIQPADSPAPSQQTPSQQAPATPPPAPAQQPAAPPRQTPQTPVQPRQAPPAQPTQQETPLPAGALFCDQCGARLRPGKRFCNNCGARVG